MLDIKNIEPAVLTVTKITPATIFMEALTTVGKTVYFNETKQSMKDILNFHGFKEISSAVRTIHYRVINSKILILNIDNFYVVDKFWVQLTDENLNYVKNYNGSQNNLLESLICINMSGYQLYETTLEAPFNERFYIKGNGEIILNNIGLSFKYEENQVMSVRIFHRKGSYVHINYINYVEKNDYLFSDFMEFAAGRINVARLINTTKKINLDITQDSDIIDVTAITLDNFHLFWNDFTPEQKLLVEMSAI